MAGLLESISIFVVLLNWQKLSFVNRFILEMVRSFYNVKHYIKDNDRQIKEMFPRFGIPHTLILDNGPSL